MLEAHGVAVSLLDENIARNLGAAGRYVGGIRLQVSQQDTSLAVELLELTGTQTETETSSNNRLSETDTIEERAPEDKRCPLCGAPPKGLITYLGDTLSRLFRGSLSSPQITCSMCGNLREM